MKNHRKHAALGKAIHFSCRWLQDRWVYLMHISRESSDAIALKLREYYADLEVDLDEFFVTGFLDCVTFATFMAGGGPIEDGLNALRFPNHVLQMRSPSVTLRRA